MLLDILDDISSFNEKSLEKINLAILIEKFEDIWQEQIIEIAKRVKNLKIITNNINSFLNLEEILYIEYGIAVQITNNKTKALVSTDIIINCNFGDDKINDYIISKQCDIINILYKVKIRDEDFEGRIINDYYLSYNTDILEEFEDKEEFSNDVLYESLIYRRDTYSNIRKQLKKDCVKLKINYLTKL